MIFTKVNSITSIIPLASGHRNVMMFSKDILHDDLMTYNDHDMMPPVARPQGWRAGASRVDRIASGLLIGIGVTLVGLRFVHASLYAEKWSAKPKASAASSTASASKP